MMRRRGAPPAGSAAIDEVLTRTAKAKSEEVSGTNENSQTLPLTGQSRTKRSVRKRKPTVRQQQRAILLMLVCFVVTLTTLYKLLKWFFPRNRYHRLLEIPEITNLLEETPAPVENDYVVFVTNSNRKNSFNVAMGRSSVSAEYALKEALMELPLPSATWKWFKIDVVTAVKTYEDYDTYSHHEELPSWWYGMALDWKKGWVFLPDEVHAMGMVDWTNRLRWDHIGSYVSQNPKRFREWPSTVLEDDSTSLSSIDILHTNAVLVDFTISPHQDDPPESRVVPLFHGHRMHTHLTHSALMESAVMAGLYLIRIVPPKGNGYMIYSYLPKSGKEPHDYNLTRHAGTLYAMACLYQEWKDNALLQAMQRGFSYLTNKMMHDCPLPYSEEGNSKCIWDWGEGKKRDTKLGVNALTVLAMAQYTVSTGDTQYLSSAIDIAKWIVGAQKEDGSFVQKVSMPDNILSEKFYVRYYQGEATFALTKLYQAAKGSAVDMSVKDMQKWLVVAEKAAAYIIERDSELEDEEVPIDHWLMYGIAELLRLKRPDANGMIPHALRIARVAAASQEQDTLEDKDRVGTFGGATGATSTATKAEGICAVYEVLDDDEYAKAKADMMDTMTYAIQFQLQEQFRPERAMYMKDPRFVLGGFHNSLTKLDMRNDYTQHNLCAILCMARALKERTVDWST